MRLYQNVLVMLCPISKLWWDILREVGIRKW